MTPPASHPAEGRSIAVLPFVNMSADPETAYFCDGITEEIINALAQIESLRVTSRTSSFFFKDKQLPLSEIANQLGVSVILEGSIRLAGKTMRITAQLIQAADDFHFWSATWDRQLNNIFAIQDEISLLIADKLREQFGHFELQDHLVNKQTDSLDAYALSLKAKYHFNKWNPTDVGMAIELYEQALDLDPQHTESCVGLADAYGFMATTEFLPREQAWQKAAAFTHRAYQLNPGNAGVHYQLANLALFTEIDYQKAFRHTQESIALKPNYPEAQQFMAFLYMIVEELEPAERHLQLAMDIDPLSQETLFYRAYYQHRARNFPLALEYARECLANNPKNIPAYIFQCYTLLKLGRYEEVWQSLAEMPEDIVIPGDRLGLRCLAAVLQGDEQKWAPLLSELEAEAQRPDHFQAHSYLFMAYANLKRVDQAFDWLEQILQWKSSVLLIHFTDPLQDPIKADPRYAEYVRKLLPHPDADADPSAKAPLLDDPTAETFADKLLQFVQEETPYLNPSLSLRSLAEQVQIHPNQLSWLLNQHLGKNFNEFINHYRVEYFKGLATDPANAHISLLGLAYESGFNSKTVFNTYFKKEVGMTPGAFVKGQH
ncbi:MAG: helix-turn-helix domain-containing protein [Lewinella sp.]|nr:helix-turn-helix domain-containing protein [Lewinella sp.]